MECAVGVAGDRYATPCWFIYSDGGRLQQTMLTPQHAKPGQASRKPSAINDTEGSAPMTTYTITITADDDSASTIRLRLETSGDQVILTDLHLHDGNGLSAGQLPAIDYGLLLRAITTTTPTPLAAPTVSTTPPTESSDTTAAATAATPARRRGRAARGAAAPAVAPKARRGGRGSASMPAAAAATQPAASGRTRRAGIGNKAATATNKSIHTARKTTKATEAKASGRTSGGTGRAYRRMPDDFAAVYQQTSSAAAVAEHYQVPRHTANGWIRRLREQGIIPTR